MISDPNFTFEGTGSSVFGAKSTPAPPPPANDDDNDEEANGEEHDPHFEPIVPLPDAIEVRTGEEDEEKGTLYFFGIHLKLISAPCHLFE